MIIVSGHGRCGSSLTMQMLAAGGMPTAGTAPAFEHDDFTPNRIIPLFVLAQHQGKAIKILDPQRSLGEVPDGTHAIWLDRDAREQAKSQMKFVRTLAPTLVETGRDAVRRLTAANRRDTPIALRRLRQICASVTRLRFEEILADPQEAASKLMCVAERTGRLLHLPAMAAAVLPRSAGCLPDMAIEARLMEARQS